MSNLDSKSLVIRKSNELIEARYKLNLAEQRLILLLASEITPDDKDFKSYQISIADFAKMFDLEPCNSLYEKVQNAANSLVGKTLQLSADETMIKMTTWLSYVEYVKGSGVIKLEFHSSLKPYLLQLKSHYTQYNLNHVINFTSQYSIRFYELLKMDAFKAKNGRFEKTFAIDDLRLVVGLAEKDYQFFKDFRIRVIDSAVKEINEKTDLYIENVAYGKTCRKMTHATFTVAILSKEQTHQKQAQLSDENHTPENITHPVVEKLIGLGFSEKLANSYKNKHGVKKIERNIAYTLAKKQEGVVKDVAAYLNVAITDDLGGAWDVKRSLDAEKSSQRKKLGQAKQAAADEAKRLVDERYQQAFAKFQALPKAEQDALKGEFAEATDHTTRASINKAQSKAKDMLTSPLVAGVFKAFLIEQKGF
jgi:plasmid replication initiation protein